MSVITAATFRDQLDLWGVDYVEHERWDRCLESVVRWSEHEARTYSTCASKGTWDANGIAMHHSGGPTAWWYVWDGRISSLDTQKVPGPLYIVLIYEDGVAHLCGWGITNNVGWCDRTVFDRVLRGEMPTSGGEVEPGPDDYGNANLHMYGIAYRGTAPNTTQQRIARLVCAAICTGHTRETGFAWDGGSIAGHDELTDRKRDPAGEDMTQFRADVNELLEVGPAQLATNVVTIGGIDFGGGTDFEIEERDMSWNEDLRPGTSGNDITSWAASIIPDGFGHHAADLLGYAAASLPWMTHKEFTRPGWPDESPTTLTRYWLWTHTHSRRSSEGIARVEAKLDAVLDSQLGANADEIKAHIDQRASEATAERDALAAKFDELQAQLDPVALAEQLAALLPAVTQADLEAALRNVLGSLDE